MWISLFAIVIAVAICLSVAAAMMLSQLKGLDFRKIALLIESMGMSMGKLTADQKTRAYNRGQNAAKKGHSRYWSEPSAYPFESDEHYQGRTEAFDRGYADQRWHEPSE
jgi:hypothetical protein